MRFLYSIAALAALVVLSPAEASAQFSISNYALVSETRITRSVSDFEYRANIVNTGVARSSVTATLTSAPGASQIIRGLLHFSNVPANGQSTSTDTFLIRVDRTVAFNLANLQWSFAVANANAPISNAGPNQTKGLQTTATLNGSGSSNPSGIGSLTYTWIMTSRPAGSVAALSNPNVIMPTFFVDRPGAYVISLTVNNGAAIDTSTVTVSTVNSPPVANAGPSQTVILGASVTLNGSNSTDVDGNSLTYAWSFVSRPAGSAAVLNNPNTFNPTFTTDRAGSYVVQLIAHDGFLNSAPATVTISTLNAAPVANAGPTQAVNVPSTVQLSGAGSTDADGNPITYLWSLVSVPAGSTAALSGTTIVNPTFSVDRQGSYVAQLIVNDGIVNSAPSTVTITTNAIPAPTAVAGNPQTVLHGSTVQLNGSATDIQSRPLTFLWSFTTRPAGSTAALSNPAIANPTFVADRPGNYILQLIANNGFINSPPSTVTITTTNSTPVANAGPNQNLPATTTLVTLNGSGSSDADSDPITYAWTFSSRPAGSTAALQAPTSVSPTFNADVPGTYVVQLIVSDQFASSTPVTVSINVAAPGQIVLPATTNLALGASTPFNVSLSSAAPLGGSTVTLVINTPGRATLSTLTVVIPAGDTVPASQPTLSGVNLGSTTIGASGPGLLAGSGTVNVNATIAFSAPTVSIIGTATQNLTLTLSSPAPAGGVVINLTSGTPGAATVPATVTILATATTVTVPITGVAAGSSLITASGTNIPAVTATANVVGLLAVTTASLPNGSQGVAYSQTLASTGGTGVKTWTLTSGTLPTGLTLSTAGVISGSTSTLISNTPLTFLVTDSGSPVQTASANLTLTIVAVTPTTIVVTSGSGQSTAISTAFAAQLVATVTGAGGAPAAGVTVTFAAPGSGASGTFAGGVNTAVTNGSGVATSAAFTANSTAGGPYNVSATVPSVTPVNFSLTNTAAAPASISVTSGSGQSAVINAQFGTVLSATVRDSGSNAVSGVTVTFTVPGSGASATIAGGITAVTNASGVATSGLLTANSTAGAYVVAATVPSVAAANFNLTNTAGPAASISVTSGSGQTTAISTAFGAPLVATVVDAGGNPVNGATVTFTAPVSGARATIGGGITAITGSNGVATSGTLTANSTAGTYNVVASVPSVTGVNFSLTNTAGAAASITATSGASQTTAISTAFGAVLTATVLDAGSNPVPGATVTFTVPGSGASATIAGGITAVTGSNGIATSGIVTANSTAGAYNIVASVPSVTGVNFGMTNTAGPAASIAVTSGSGQTTTVSTAFGAVLTATVLDASSNPVSGATVTFTVPASGARATIAGGITAVTNASGVATSGIVTANATAGTYNIAASVPSVTAVNFSMTNTAGAATSLSVTSGSGQTTVVGTAFGAVLTATARDAGSNPVSGVTVTFVVPGSSASASIAGGLTAVTGVNGVATSGVVTANGITGTYNISASIPSVAAVNFSMTNTAGAPASITATAGSGQTTPVSSPFASPLSATVRDAGNNLVGAGVNVTFTAPGSGASGTFAGGALAVTTATNASGVATSTIFSANSTAGGPYAVVASSGASTTANFSLTNTAVAAPNTLLLSNLTVGKGLQAQFTLTLTTPAPAGGLTVNFTSSNGAAVLLAGRPGDTGAASLTGGSAVIVGEGSTTVTGIFAHGIADTGSATVTASAAGWTSGTGTVTLTPSGFRIQGPGGTGVSTFTVPTGVTNTPITITAIRLTASLDFAEVQQVRGGTTVVVPLTSSAPSVGTIPATASIGSPNGQAANSAATVNFSSLAVGATSLTAGTPANFSTPNGAINVVTATVTATGLIANPITVGRNLELLHTISASSPAPSDTTVTITTSDPNLRFSATANGAGVATLNLTIQTGRTVTGDFYVYALTNTGTASYTATAAGYSSASGTVNFGNSGFVVRGPAGTGANFNMTSAAANQSLDIISALLDSGGNVVTAQSVQGGITASVNVVSSSPSIGAIIASPLTFNGGVGQVSTDFDPISGGSTTVSVSTATAGFTTPTTGASLVVTISAPGIFVTGATAPETIGKNLQIAGSFSLGAAVTSPTLVTITSNSANILLSTTSTGAGSSSITITQNSGTTSGFFIQALADTGTGTITASAPGYSSRTGTITFAPSGIAITGPLGFVFPNAFSTSSFGRTVTVFTDVLEVGTNRALFEQDLRGGLTLNITFTSSNGLGVAVPATSIVGGTGSGVGGVNATFTNTTQGQTNISVVTPSGFTTTTGTYSFVVATINN